MHTKIINNKGFEDIKNVAEDGLEYWSARELMPMLEYSRWEKFQNVIEKAQAACNASEQRVVDHFHQMGKTVKAGAVYREIHDVMLTRYACYLIAQNGDSSKPAIAMAQTYFAVQARKQEILAEEARKRAEEDKRLEERFKLTQIEKDIRGTVYTRGIVESIQFARFKDEHIKALYNGKTTKELKAIRQIAENRSLADFDSTIELAAKSLALAMTDKNIYDKDLHGEDQLNKEVRDNSLSVRRSLTDRGIRPEDFPAQEDVKIIQKRRKKEGLLENKLEIES